MCMDALLQSNAIFVKHNLIVDFFTTRDLQLWAMEYEIIEKSWSKRRKLDTNKAIRDIKFTDLIKQHDHFCQMHVYYVDGSEDKLIARVIYNPIKDHWTVDGLKVAVRLL